MYGFAVNKLKCFGDKTPPINPTQNIEILKDDESRYKGSKWNEISFDDQQIHQVDKALIQLVRKCPFESEAVLLYNSCKLRPEELLKLKKTDLKDGYILFRKEIQKERSLGKVEDKKIYYTTEIIRALDRLNRQYNRRGHEKYKFIPWLFPASRIDWGNPDQKYRQSNKTRKKSLKGVWDEVKKLIKFEGSLKTIRKTYFTLEVELERSKGKTTDEAIEIVSKDTHKSPKMLKTRYKKDPESVKIKKALNRVAVV